jgi:putative tricarboxylic transport membrane protein
MDVVLNAVAVVLQPSNILLVMLGVFIGILFGAIPGLTATLAIALLSPLTFSMEPVPALIMLLGIFAGGMYGGSITAITLRTPGAPANAATVADGYALTQQGKGGVAVGISCVSGATGGLISCTIMIFFAPILAKFALLFSAPEYFSVALFGLTAVFSVSGSSLLKGLFAALLGLLFATTGYDPILPIPRFHFGYLELSKGLPFLPAVIGLFAFAEVFRLITKYLSEEQYDIVKIGRVFPKLDELRQIWRFMIRGGFWGTLIGILPGAGGTIAAYVAYGDARRASKHPEKFGQGSLEGIAAPEAGNNAVTGGAVIPMLTLGIPGDSVTAILLGALTIQGLQPGPLLFTQHTDIVYPLFAGMVLSNFFLIIIGLLVVKPFSQIATIPKPLLISFLTVFGVMGAYASSGGIFDVWVALLFGVLGFFMERFCFPVAPVVLGMILGPLVENSLRQSLLISDGNPMIFFSRPISCAFLLLSVLVVVYIAYSRIRKEKVKECSVS